MKRRGHLLAALLVVAAASLALGFSTGPEDGRTNAPSESNCTVGCHSSFALNSGDGNFEITLSDSAYLSGES